LQRAFPLDVPKVPSSTIVVGADGERLTCGGFSLGKTVHRGNFEFITDYLGDLSLAPRRGNTGAAFISSTHSRASTTQRAKIEDSTEEFLMASSWEGSFNLPSPRRHNTGASLAPLRTTPWMQDPPSTQTMMTVPHGQQYHGRKLAPLPSDVMLITRGAAGAIPCSTTHCQARGSATAKQAHRQASHYRGSTACATAA
jgi:hypothetical protein